MCIYVCYFFSKKGTIIYLVKSQVITIAGGPIISGKPRDGIETTKIDSGSKKEEIICENFTENQKFWLQ